MQHKKINSLNQHMECRGSHVIMKIISNRLQKRRMARIFSLHAFFCSSDYGLLSIGHQQPDASSSASDQCTENVDGEKSEAEEWDGWGKEKGEEEDFSDTDEDLAQRLLFLLTEKVFVN